MMFISARAFLWVGFVFCILPFAPVADEVNAGDEPTQVTAPPAPQVSPETPVDNPDTSPESVEETPPNLSGNSEDSKVAPDLSELEAKSAAIRDNLKEAVGLADQLTLTLNAVREMQDNLAPVTDTFSVSASTPVADNVHVIIMADTRPISGRQANPIAKGAGVNAEIMKSLLEKQCFDTTSKPAINHLEKSGVRVLRDGDFSFQKLQQELNAASVGSNDVLFVYIACHGLTFAEGSHGFQMPTQNTGREILRRSTVWDLMKTKKARQTILISDCCANQQPVSEAVAAPSALIGLATNALSKLLLFQIGDIDVNGSSRPPADPGDGKRGGQFGIYRETGGFFTVAFYGAATGTPLPVSWKKLFDNCQSKLDDQFKPPVPVNVPGRGTINVSRQNHELIRD